MQWHAKRVIFLGRLRHLALNELRFYVPLDKEYAIIIGDVIPSQRHTVT